MAADLVTAFAVVSLASAFGGVILEYVWSEMRHNRKGHRR